MDLINGFLTFGASPVLFLYVLLGGVAGILVGAIPGMSIAAVIAMLLPITFFMDPLSALVFLYVFGKAGRYGGSISAILLNTPGTVSAAATMQDGFPLTRQGRSKSALRMSAVASVMGDFIGDMFLIFAAVLIAGYTEKFGPAEYFAIYFMAFVVIGSVVSDSVSKGLTSAALGVLLALVGSDPITGMARLSFGSLEMERGLGLVPILVGIFVFSELFDQARIARAKKQDNSSNIDTLSSDDDPGISKEEWRIAVPVIFRSSLVGTVIGTLPGLGSAVACFIAYGEEKRRAKRPHLWGKGALEGVAAPESANNAVSGPSMIPLLTLGVPGSTIAALLMGLFMIHGIQIGPTIFQTSRDLVYTLFASGLMGILLYGCLGYYFAPLFGRYITSINEKYIYPFVFVTALVAAYATTSSFANVILMTIFGFFGYFMRRFHYPSAAFIIAFILGRGAEESLRQSVMLDSSGILVFLDHPVAMTFIVIGLSVAVWRVYLGYKTRANTASEVVSSTNLSEAPVDIINSAEANKIEKIKEAHWGETLFSAGLAIGSAVFAYESLQAVVHEQGLINARSLPFALAITVLCFASIQLIGKLRLSWGTPIPNLNLRSTLITDVIPLTVLMLLYVFLIQAIGYLPATGIVMIMVFLIFGVRGLAKILLLSTATAVLSFLLFVQTMGIFMPTPWLSIF